MFGFNKKEKVIKAIQRVETTAKLIHKSDDPIDDLLSGVMLETTPILELTFLCEDGSEVIATVSEFEFGAVEIGDEGKLTFDRYKYCNEVVSFADKIKAFSMEDEV